MVTNTAMIRRRIRDPRLVFHMMNVGQSSRTDVCLGYMKELADEAVVKELIGKIQGIKIDTLTVGDQSLVEALDKRHWLNPFPKIRYSERPDVVAAHLTEGSLVILVDNSPTAIILPTGFFDFLQDADDYYFPVITGSYLRLVRNITMLASIFVTPIYLLVDRGILAFPNSWNFLMPQESYPIPLFWQFLILEIAVDGLKLASLNTPSSLSTSLSVIGALLLGELSISAGWFIPQPSCSWLWCPGCFFSAQHGTVLRFQVHAHIASHRLRAVGTVGVYRGADHRDHNTCNDQNPDKNILPLPAYSL